MEIKSLIEPLIPLKVSALNALVREALESGFRKLQVVGEISNLARPASGHLYFSLKDEKAEIRAVMFNFITQTLNFIPKNGDKVVVTAQLTLYEARGSYQLNVARIVLAGKGTLYQRFLLIKEQLNQEGYFAPEHKRTLPKWPQAVGVITSPTGAVIRDIVRIVHRRAPQTKIIVYPASVQGNDAVSTLVAALRLANLRAECDLLILARGGGSLEDLWSFNEPEVVKAIFASEIPVISAVGHETDVTLADFAADLRTPTPSAAAELAVPDCQQLIWRVQEMRNNLKHRIKHLLYKQSLRLRMLKSSLRDPKIWVISEGKHVHELKLRLKQLFTIQFELYRHQLAKFEQALTNLNPEAVLARGYAILRDEEGTVVPGITGLKVGTKINTILLDGSLISEIIKISPKKL